MWWGVKCKVQPCNHCHPAHPWQRTGARADNDTRPKWQGQLLLTPGSTEAATNKKSIDLRIATAGSNFCAPDPLPILAQTTFLPDRQLDQQMGRIDAIRAVSQMPISVLYLPCPFYLHYIYIYFLRQFLPKRVKCLGISALN